MKRVIRIRQWLLICCCCALLPPAAGRTLELQEPARADGLVELFVSVSDENRRLVLGLAKDQFDVYVDGNPRPIAAFDATPGPLSVVLLIDTSGTMTPVLDVAAGAADEFLKRLHPSDVALVGGFNNKVVFRPESGFTGSLEALRGGMRNFKAGYATVLFDAIDQSIERLKTRTGRRVVIVLTDGEDSASKRRAADVMTHARAAGVTVYAIGVYNQFFDGRRRVRTSPDDDLKKLIADGGGVLSMQQSADWGRAFAVLAQELHAQYRLTFAPPALDGKVHDVEVRMKAPDLTARTRKTFVLPKGAEGRTSALQIRRPMR